MSIGVEKNFFLGREEKKFFFWGATGIRMVTGAVCGGMASGMPVELVPLEATASLGDALNGTNPDATLGSLKVNLGAAIAFYESRDASNFGAMLTFGVFPVAMPVRFSGGDRFKPGLVGMTTINGSNFYVKVEVFNESKKEKFERAVSGIRTYGAMNECGVVRFRSWSGIIPVERRSTTPEKLGVIVIVMQALSGTLTTVSPVGAPARMETDVEEMPRDELGEVKDRDALGRFLNRLLDCLMDKNTSYVDLSPKNVGYERAADGNYQFRLIDIDSIGGTEITPGYNLFGQNVMSNTVLISGLQEKGRKDLLDEYLRMSTIFSAMAIGAEYCTASSELGDDFLLGSKGGVTLTAKQRIEKAMMVLSKDESPAMQTLATRGRELVEYLERLRENIASLFPPGLAAMIK